MKMGPKDVEESVVEWIHLAQDKVADSCEQGNGWKMSALAELLLASQNDFTEDNLAAAPFHFCSLASLTVFGQGVCALPAWKLQVALPSSCIQANSFMAVPPVYSSTVNTRAVSNNLSVLM
jgi:hypothetical protein